MEQDSLLPEPSFRDKAHAELDKVLNAIEAIPTDDLNIEIESCLYTTDFNLFITVKE
jgi:hypothetical protein